jgi:hypothetical protein
MASFARLTLRTAELESESLECATGAAWRAKPLLVHHESRRVGPAEHFGQVRVGIPHLPQMFRSASSAGCIVRRAAVARPWAHCLRPEII